MGVAWGQFGMVLFDLLLGWNRLGFGRLVSVVWFGLVWLGHGSCVGSWVGSWVGFGFGSLCSSMAGAAAGWCVGVLLIALHSAYRLVGFFYVCFALVLLVDWLVEDFGFVWG